MSLRNLHAHAEAVEAMRRGVFVARRALYTTLLQERVCWEDVEELGGPIPAREAIHAQARADNVLSVSEADALVIEFSEPHDDEAEGSADA